MIASVSSSSFSSRVRLALQWLMCMNQHLDKQRAVTDISVLGILRHTARTGSKLSCRANTSLDTSEPVMIDTFIH